MFKLSWALTFDSFGDRQRLGNKLVQVRVNLYDVSFDIEFLDLGWKSLVFKRGAIKLNQSEVCTVYFVMWVRICWKG